VPDAGDAAADLEAFRIDVCTLIRGHMADQRIRSANIFTEADTNGDNKISREEFLALVTRCRGSFAPAQLNKLFDYLDDGNAGHLEKEAFSRLLRLYYKVEGATALTDGMDSVAGPLRELEVGEFLELVEGPLRESTGALRVQCTALRDQATGWATVTGASGSPVLLAQTRMHVKIVASTVLTQGFQVEDSRTLRTLTEGELAEVLEWERVEEPTGLKRMKLRATRDSLVGWATSAGNNGNVFVALA